MLVTLLGYAIEDRTEENVAENCFFLCLCYLLETVAGAGQTSLEAIWYLMVSAIQMDAVKMIFPAERKVVVNHDSRIPFRVDFLQQSFAVCDAGIRLAQMQQVESCLEELVDVVCLILYEIRHGNNNPFHDYSKNRAL